MTPSDLYTAIEADSQAAALAAAGNDAGCAARMTAILPPVAVSRFVDGSTVLAAYPSPATGYGVWSDLQTVAGANAVLKFALGWMAPGAPGLNIGNPAVVAMLNSLAGAAGTTYLTQANINVLVALGQQPQAVAQQDVQLAMAPYRSR